MVFGLSKSEKETKRVVDTKFRSNVKFFGKKIKKGGKAIAKEAKIVAPRVSKSFSKFSKRTTSKKRNIPVGIKRTLKGFKVSERFI